MNIYHERVAAVPGFWGQFQHNAVYAWLTRMLGGCNSFWRDAAMPLLWLSTQLYDNLDELQCTAQKLELWLPLNQRGWAFACWCGSYQSLCHHAPNIWTTEGHWKCSFLLLQQKKVLCKGMHLWYLMVRRECNMQIEWASFITPASYPLSVNVRMRHITHSDWQ